MFARDNACIVGGGGGICARSIALMMVPPTGAAPLTPERDCRSVPSDEVARKFKGICRADGTIRSCCCRTPFAQSRIICR